MTFVVAVASVLWLTLWSAPAAGAPALVQTAATLNNASASSISQAFSTANTSANLIVVTTSFGTRGANPTVTDTQGNTYALVASSYSSSGDQSLAICYAKNIKGGANAVTVSFGGSHAWRRILVAEYSGVDPIDAVDVFAVKQGSATTAADNVTSGTVTTRYAGDLIFGAVENFNVSGTVRAGSGFGLRNSLLDSGLIETAIEDRLQSAPGLVAATFTYTRADPYIAAIVAFKAVQGGSDVVAPSVPTNLIAASISASQINLSWAASGDNVAVTGYQIFRNGSLIATSTVTSYSDTGLAASTSYSYAIAAYDASGNVSGQSTPATATTQAAPTAPVISSFTAAPSSIIAGQSSLLSWSVSGNPAPALSIDQGVGTVTGTSINVSPPTTTTYTLTATSPSGARTAQATITVGPAADSTPPSIPGSVSVSSISASQIDLSWSPSTDNVAVVGYLIFRNGAQVATSINPFYSDLGLAASSSYTYAITAIDAAGNVSGQSSPTTAVTQASSASKAYPVKLDPGRTYLVDQSGQPFFIVGDAAWSLIAQLSDADVDTYLADRVAKGYNSILVNLIEHAYAANPPADYYGNQPFMSPGDFSAPNEAYFQHADFVIGEAARYGITVLLAPAYVGYDCGYEGWCAEMLAASSAQMTAWGQYVGNRYKNYPNIIWLIGGDANPTQFAGLQSTLNRIATGIKSTDTSHLMTAHNVRGQSALDVWSGYSWLDVNDLYNLPQDISAKASAECQRPDFLPFFLLEDYYEGEHNMTPLQLRTEGYVAVLSGARLGRFFGNYAIWNFSSPSVTGNPWQAQLNSVGSIGQANLGDLFRSRAHWKLIPDVNHTVMTAGSQSGTTLGVASRTDDGQSIIAYLPTQRTVTINMTMISDVSAKAWWFNPQTASSTLVGTFPTTGTQNFTSPDQNDWVLVIDSASANLPSPGLGVYAPLSDTLPPYIPDHLTASSISASQINLSWTASTDNIAVVGYQIIRNGSQVATSAAPSYSDTGLAASTTYTFAVAAFDAAGNVSGISPSATATTGLAADSTLPTVVVTAPLAGTTVNGTVLLQATATDGSLNGQFSSGVASVQFRLNGAALGTAITTAPYVLSWNSAGANNAPQTITAVATDAAGNGATSLPISITVDNQAPSGSVAMNGGANLVNSAAVTLSLTAADNSGTVALMRFSNDGIAFSSPQAYATFASWTLTPGDGGKTVHVQFSDAVGNWSSTYTASVTLDSTAPAIVANSITITWDTDEPATSQVEYGTTLAYGSSTPLDPLLRLSHSVILNGLVPQTMYNYRIHSRNAAGTEKISLNGQFLIPGND